MSALDSRLIAKVEPHLRCNIGSVEQLIIIKIISVNSCKQRIRKILCEDNFSYFLMFDNIIKNGLNENFL